MLCLSNSMNWLINETVLTGNSPGSRRGGNQTIYNKWYTSIKQNNLSKQYKQWNNV